MPTQLFRLQLIDLAVYDWTTRDTYIMTKMVALEWSVAQYNNPIDVTTHDDSYRKYIPSPPEYEIRLHARSTHDSTARIIFGADGRPVPEARQLTGEPKCLQ